MRKGKGPGLAIRKKLYRADEWDHQTESTPGKICLPAGYCHTSGTS